MLRLATEGELPPTMFLLLHFPPPKEVFPSMRSRPPSFPRRRESTPRLPLPLLFYLPFPSPLRALRASVVNSSFFFILPLWGRWHAQHDGGGS
jgi:hypothetical protein